LTFHLVNAPESFVPTSFFNLSHDLFDHILPFGNEFYEEFVALGVKKWRLQGNYFLTDFLTWYKFLFSVLNTKLDIPACPHSYDITQWTDNNFLRQENMIKEKMKHLSLTSDLDKFITNVKLWMSHGYELANKEYKNRVSVEGMLKRVEKELFGAPDGLYTIRLNFNEGKAHVKREKKMKS